LEQNGYRRMKSSIVSMALLLALTGVDAQRTWQEIRNPGMDEIAARFKSPPAEYGMILWWGWDGHMSDTVIKRDLDRIRAMGFSGVMLEAGYGMTARYLSPGWFEMVRIAVREAKKRGMTVWIEDEGKYPSGFAGGRFSTERPDLKMRGLVVIDRFDAAGGEKISRKLPCDALSAVAYNSDDGSTIVLDVSPDELGWEVPRGSWQVVVVGHRYRSSNTRSVNNPTRGKDTTASLMDYLNPLATRQFMEWTHEQYKRYIGDEFGRTFMGFMGDEPDFAYTPWTPKMPEIFREMKGYDITPHLATFFLPEPDEEARRMKADYWDVWSALFRDNFFTVQAEWCRENRIEYIVHLNHEDQLPWLVRSSGDYFRNMRHVGVPGVDAIWAQIWMDHVADYPKLASSAAHLYGRPRAFTESFAAYTYRPNVSQAKWVIDYQLVRGINSVQVMFMPASTGRHTGAPQETGQPARRMSFFQTDTFPPVAGYIHRASYLLSMGQPAAQVGVYFPTLSLWYGETESDSSLLEISRQLTEQQIDFDFVDEQAFSSTLTLRDQALVNLSGQAYRAIIVPSVSVMSETALELLGRFAAAGGKVIFTGNLPKLMTGKTFIDAKAKSEIPGVVIAAEGGITPEVTGLLPDPDVRITPSLPQVKYLHRKLAGGELYFFFNEGTIPVSFDAELEGEGEIQVWDAFTAEITPAEHATAGEGSQPLRIFLNGWETKFVVIKRQ